jgi:hypothetical protein
MPAMRNSAFEARDGRVPGLADVLQNPVFTNVVRLLLIVILSLGGYIWKTEMNHVNRALEDIKAGVNESLGRQWRDIHDVRQEVSQMNQELYGILYRTNELLSELARPADARPVRPRTRPGAAAKN